MDFKKVFEKFFNKKDSKKTIMNLVILLIFGVLLILVGDIVSNMNTNKNKTVKNSVEVTSNAKAASASNSYDEKIKRDLSEALMQIEGVGKVNVIIYFDGGSESIPAMNISDMNKKTEEKDGQNGTRVTTEVSKQQNIVIVNEGGGSKPFILKQLNPSIGGVMIVAEGADNPQIKERLHTAVKTVLNLPTHRVVVMPMQRK